MVVYYFTLYNHYQTLYNANLMDCKTLLHFEILNNDFAAKFFLLHAFFPFS